MRTYKLASHKGTLLGTITVPDQVARYLDERGFAQMALPDQLLFYDWEKRGAPDTLSLRHATFQTSYLVRDAITLDGISLEEFEKIPNCSFAPGAAYLRSVVSE